MSERAVQGMYAQARNECVFLFCFAAAPLFKGRGKDTGKLEVCLLMVRILVHLSQSQDSNG